MGFELYATEGNAKIISDFGMEVKVVNKIHENSEDNLLTLLDSGKIDYVISTSAKGRDPRADSVKMRRHAVEKDIPCLTSLDTANAIELHSRILFLTTILINVFAYWKIIKNK